MFNVKRTEELEEKVEESGVLKSSRLAGLVQEAKRIEEEAERIEQETLSILKQAARELKVVFSLPEYVKDSLTIRAVTAFNSGVGAGPGEFIDSLHARNLDTDREERAEFYILSHVCLTELPETEGSGLDVIKVLALSDRYQYVNLFVASRERGEVEKLYFEESLLEELPERVLRFSIENLVELEGAIRQIIAEEKSRITQRNSELQSVVALYSLER